MEYVNLDDFDQEKTCTYKGETYSVRDNGYVFRHLRKGGRRSKWTEVWTLGRPGGGNYLFISNIPVHRIVATAFHGEHPPDKTYVDHFDRNRQNNRPENLSWVSPLENALLNPNTLKVIIDSYGSLENFFENLNQPKSNKPDTNLGWMRPGTKEEMENLRRNMSEWVKKGRLPSGGEIGEWIFKSAPKQPIQRPKPNDLIDSLTLGAVQKKWKTPNEFPLCPATIGENTLDEYLQHLKEGEVFSRDQYGEAKVVSAALTESLDALVVMCNKPGVKDWSLARVYIEDQHIVHEARGTYFRLDGAQKYFTLERGLEWEGGDTFDDYV